MKPKYFAIHLPSGCVTELLGLNIKSSKKIILEADFYFASKKNNTLSYSFYKEECNDLNRIWIPKKQNKLLFELLIYKGPKNEKIS